MRAYLTMAAIAAAAAMAWGGSSASAEEAQGAFQAPDGKSIYLEHCKTCHGVIGEPTKSARSKYDSMPSFKDPGFFTNRSQDSIVTVLKEGKGKDMKSFSEKLTDAELVSVAQYIRTLGAPK